MSALSMPIAFWFLISIVSIGCIYSSLTLQNKTVFGGGMHYTIAF